LFMCVCLGKCAFVCVCVCVCVYEYMYAGVRVCLCVCVCCGTPSCTWCPTWFTVFSNHFSSCTYTMDTFPKHLTQWALQTHTSAYQLTFGVKCTTTTTPQPILP